MIETQLPPTAAGNLASVRPSAALAFLAPPPLIAGEDAAAYDDLLARISTALEPSDILEEIWVRDVVDMVWDALRLRRLKAQLLTVSAYEGMHTILRRFLDWQFSEQVARQWALRDQAAVTKAEAVLASAGLTAEARRNAVLREIERHRASFARTLRRAVREVEDAEDAEEVEGAAFRLIATDESVPDAARETPA